MSQDEARGAAQRFPLCLLSLFFASLSSLSCCGSGGGPVAAADAVVCCLAFVVGCVFVLLFF